MNPLYDVPGLAGYLAGEEQQRKNLLGQLEQVGFLQKLAAGAEARNREQAYRQEIGAAATPEERAAVAAKFSGPDAVLKSQQDALNRQAQREATAAQYAMVLQQRNDALEERKRQFDTTQASEAAKRQFEEWYKTEQLKNSQILNNMNLQFKQFGMQLQQQGNQIQLQRLQDQQKQREEQQRIREEKDIEGAINKTSDRMKDVMPVYTSARQLNSILGQFNPQNVPGVGYLKNTDIGKFFLSDQGKDVASSIKLFGNSVLKAMSGAAVTAPEEVRQMAAQMADGRFSAEDFYIAWPKMAQWVNEQVSLGAAGLTPKAREKFVERTGLKLDPITPRFTYEGGQLKDSTAVPPPPPGFKVDK